MTKNRSAGRASPDLRRTVDQDGVVEVELRRGRRERWIWIFGLTALGALVGLVLGLWSWLAPAKASGGHQVRGNEQAPEAVSQRPRAPRSRRAPSPALVSVGAGAGATGAEEAAPAGEDPEDQEGEGTDEPSPGQVRVGIDLFPARGTKPIKRGIVVPDDFELPPGYVRHFQTTDRGRMLEGILMFHPEHKPLDANGDPIPLPPDRIVPPEMAPPGLPIRMLEVPAEEEEPFPQVGDPRAGGGDEDTGEDGSDTAP